MSDQYLGEIRMFGGNFAPYGWALCNGQLLAISQNTALFSLIGTYYGGDGVTTFALPNLQSRVPLHQGQGAGLSPYTLGQLGGTESVTLTTLQMPQHNHSLNATPANANNNRANAATLASSTNSTNIYSNVAPAEAMNAGSIGFAGSSQPHTNVQPYLTITFIIALQGIYPSRN
jgi:microcystin-dependent protein